MHRASTAGPPAQGDTNSNPTGAASGGPTSPGILQPPSRTEHLKRWAQLSRLRKLVDQGSNSLGPLKTAVTDLAECIGVCEDMVNGRKEYDALKDQLEKIFEMLNRHYSSRGSPTITATVEGLFMDIKSELQGVKRKLNRDRLNRFGDASTDLDDVLRCYGRVRDLLQRVSLNADISMWRIVDELATDTRLRSLQPALSACYNSSQAIELKRGLCTEGTRKDVLSRIGTWVHTCQPGSVYWINGMAGTGKTTIAYSLCSEFDDDRRLVASFFCSRSLPECRDVNRIVPSIAYQLARSSRPFRSVLSESLEKDPDVHTRLSHLQFDALIAKPLLEVKDTLPENLVIVIDALDECDSKDTTRRVLDVLLTKSANLPVKFILSSRPEPEIRDNMTMQSDPTRSRVVLHELGAKVVQADIELYLRTALSPIQPTEDQVVKLAKRAGVLFIYAATAVRYIGYDNFQRNPTVRLAQVMGIPQTKSGDEMHAEIDKLYMTVLQAALDDSKLNETEGMDMRQVLHTVICAQEPLTVAALSGLLGMNDVGRVRAALRPLWSVVHVSGASEVVTTLHASFPDYTLDQTRSGKYHCDPQTHNQTLALRCFDCFRRMSPQFNICGLESSFVIDDEVGGFEERVQRVITMELAYAARYWAIHLCSATVSLDLAQELEEFLSVRLLLWMEVMNLKKYASVMAETIRLVEKCDRQYSDDLRALIHDAWRFTTTFASGAVSRSTPHIYTSMLPLWPESSPIGERYAKRMQGMNGIHGTAIGQCQHSLLATWHHNNCFSACFSPDGTQIAVVVDYDILLLNLSTGRRMLPAFKGHTYFVASVQFSPDGSKIVSGSYDCTIRVWNTQTGETVLGPLMKHDDVVESVVFSPCGSRIVSGSVDGAIYVWEADTGDIIFDHLKGASEGNTTVKYSHDGRHIVSLSDTRPITVWDSETGHIRRYIHHSDSSTRMVSMDISSDSERIAYGTENNNIYISDIHNGRVVLGPLMTPNRSSYTCITSVAFSHDGHWISGSSENVIYMWDAHTGDLLLGPLEGHTSTISFLSFSPDGAYILSGSDDQTIRLWHTRGIQTAHDVPHGHSGSITSVGVSPDGSRVVSSANDGTVCVWNVETGGLVTTIPEATFAHPKWPTYEEKNNERHIEILRVGFSPDSTRIIANTSRGPFVFVANNGALRDLYDQPIATLIILTINLILGFAALHRSLFRSLPVYDEGNGHVANPWSSTRTLNLLTWLFDFVLDILIIGFGLRTPTNPLAALIAQAVLLLAIDIRLFGDVIFGPVDVYSPNISCAGFSSDGTRIVSGSADGIIRVHDAHTNKLSLVIILPRVQYEDPRVKSVSFSSDSCRILSHSGERKQQVHCAYSGKLLADLNCSEWGRHPVLSPDGTHVIVQSSGTRHTSVVDLATGKRSFLKEVMYEGLSSEVWDPSRDPSTFMADGSRIAFVFRDQSIGIRDAHTGEKFLQAIKVAFKRMGRLSKVSVLASMPHGEHLIAGSYDGTIRIINTQPTPATPSTSSPPLWDWKMNEDGWVVDDEHRLLIWAPPELRSSLMWPRVERLMSRRGWLKLDFNNTNIGELWVKCYRSE